MGRMKLILGGLVVIVVAVVVGGIAVLKSIDFNQYKGEIQEQAKKATGRDLTIAGNIGLEISLSPRVVVEGVSFANASWGSRPEMVKLKKVAVQVELIPLLSGNISVKEVTLLEPDILIETDKKGVGNWVFDTQQLAEEAKAEKPASSGGGSIPAVESLRIEKANFVYLDGVSGKKETIVIDLIEGNSASLSSPLNLLVKMAYNGHPIELTGGLSTPQAMISGEPVNLNFDLKAGGSTVKLTGVIADLAAAKGINLNVKLASPDVSKLAAIGGASAPALGPVDVSLGVRDTASGFAIQGLNVKIGTTDLAGNVDLALNGKKPAINAQLTSSLIDLKDFSAKDETAAAPAAAQPAAEEKPAKSTKVFPADTFPVEGLKAVDAKLNFKGKSIRGPNLSINDVDLTLSLKDGLLQVQPLQAGIGGGTLNTGMTLDARKLPVTLSLKVDGQSLGLGNMMVETGVTDLIGGASTMVTVNLNGSGKSVAQLMGSLDGKMLVNVGKGKINNKYVNFAGADLVSEVVSGLNPFAAKEDFTILKCAVVNLNFKQGVAKYDDAIAVETDKMTIVSSGEINMKSEELDIGVEPKPRKDSVDLGIGAGSLVSMVRVGGTFGEPSVGLDALNTAKAAMGVASAIATGGMSLLIGGLVDKATSDSEPCQTALAAK